METLLILNKANYKILFTKLFRLKNYTVKTIFIIILLIERNYSFWLKKRHLISIEKIHSIKNIYIRKKKIKLKKKKKRLISTELIYEPMPHAWVMFKRQTSMKSPCGILWKGVLEPLTHVCTDLKISKESNALIKVIVMW